MKKIFLFMVSLCGFLAGAACAQDLKPAGDAGAGNPPRRPKPPIFTAIDTNQDNLLSADEIAQAAAALKTLDKNGDGQLSREECLPPHPRGPMDEAGKNQLGNIP